MVLIDSSSVTSDNVSVISHLLDLLCYFQGGFVCSNLSKRFYQRGLTRVGHELQVELSLGCLEAH